MCCGGLDPKHQMRDIEARLKTYGFQSDTKKQAAPDGGLGLMARLRVIRDWFLRKEAPHV